MSRGVLVAGIGNLFLTDDGFGSEVARSLAAGPLPDGVTVVDYGIRGMHLVVAAAVERAVALVHEVLDEQLGLHPAAARTGTTTRGKAIP